MRRKIQKKRKQSKNEKIERVPIEIIALKARADWMQQQEIARYELMMLEEMERRGIR